MRKFNFDIYNQNMVIDKMDSTLLCIGDPHIQVANIPETDLLIERLVNLAKE